MWALQNTLLLTLVTGLFVQAGCNEKPAAQPPASPPSAATETVPDSASATEQAADLNPTQGQTAPIPAPRGQLLYQPNFFWADGDETAQGTGFFVKAPSGKLAAVTSAHFIDPDGPALVKAQWQTIDGEKLVATLTKSWGPPGKLGRSRLDQRGDYLLFPVELDLEISNVLEFDPRPRIAPDELIWFVDKGGSKSAADQRVVTGRVTSATAMFLNIQLDEPTELQSQSGSPFISQSTGRVIGILSGAIGEGDSLELIAAPVNKMVAQLQDESSFPELRTVIGKAEPNDQNKTLESPE